MSDTTMNDTTRQKLSVIYDITRQCPMKCPICCMGALPGPLARQGELTLAQKLQLMDQLAEVNKTRDVHIDFSGGEIFTNTDENVQVLERAASLLGREKVSVSSSGYRINDALARRLSTCISECEMTMDCLPGEPYLLRPKEYAQAAVNALPHLRKYCIPIGIQTVLAKPNSDEAHLRAMYKWLCANGIDRWSLLRFYPSGRGRFFEDQRLSAEDEAHAVSLIRQMEQANASRHKPSIDFHYTMPGHAKYTTVCRCVRKSIGILPDGRVTGCFWAVDADMNITDDSFYLGSVAETSLAQILSGPKAEYWMSCEHCCEFAAHNNGNAA